MKQFIKDPDSTLNYGVDWSDWLDAGDTIIASTWTVPTGLTNMGDTFTATQAVIYVSGGTKGETYTITNKITTSSSPAKIDERSIQLVIRDR